MHVKCDYCGTQYEDTLAKCPSCAAPNPTKKNDGKPRTVEELKAWYAARKLPPEEVTRFFIGRDIREPKAIGIYRGGDGDFVVYKNKADGTRAVRYKGGDEEYAVNEVYQKLKDEIVHQKASSARNARTSGGASPRTRTAGNSRMVAVFACIWIAFAILSIALSSFQSRNNGYYNYGGTTYYKYRSLWYEYDQDLHDWERASSVPGTLEGYYGNYYEGADWDGEWGVTDFEDSRAHDQAVSEYSSSHDSDSDWDWDSGDSWDSGGTDWDSDW